MTQGRQLAYTEEDRRVRLLLALHRSDCALTLAEASTAAGDDNARQAKSATSRMLRYLRNDGLVDYIPPEAGQERRLGGTYLLNKEGREWLLEHKFLSSEESDDEEEIVTGAMHSECRTVIESRAYSGQAPAGAIASVFHLGRAIAAEAA